MLSLTPGSSWLTQQEPSQPDNHHFTFNIQPKWSNLEIRNKFFNNRVVETWNKLQNFQISLWQNQDGDVENYTTEN